MKTHEEALKIARVALGVQLDALLGKAGHLHNDDRRRYAENGIKAIDEALAQQSNEQVEPVALNQVYRCKIKSRSQINREIPREKQGWWADVSAGQKLLLRQAVQADIDRCSLNAAHSKNPADYMCETHTNGSLVSKIALEYMNPEQNVFAHPPVPTAQPKLQTCNCRWDGEVQVQQCTLHESHVDAVHEWAERAKTAEAKLKAQHKEPEKQPVGFVVDLYNNVNTPSLPPTPTVAWLNGNPKIGQVLYADNLPQFKLTDKMVHAAARALSDAHADSCEVDKDDHWKMYGDVYNDDARIALEAALSVKENA